MTLAFLADEHVRRVFVVEHLERSRETGRIVLSNDSGFARLGNQRDHAEVLLYDGQTMSVSTFIRGIRRIERFVSPDQFRGEIVWLDDWIE